jgi:3-deoxy-7-phosphoheptulonate synthase
MDVMRSIQKHEIVPDSEPAPAKPRSIEDSRTKKLQERPAADAVFCGLRPGKTSALMIVAMQDSASEDQIQQVIDQLVHFGFEVHRSTGAQQTVLGGVGVPRDFDTREVEMMPGVQEVHRITSPYKWRGAIFVPKVPSSSSPTGLKSAARKSWSWPGPARSNLASNCSPSPRLIAKRERAFFAAARSSRALLLIRFRGSASTGLKLLREAGDRFKLLVISEVMEISQIELMLPYVDIFQVGARNMQNFNLLRELGKVRKPVLLKRGIAATIEELLLSAEYLLAGGNYEIILCERGIRTFETYTRNTMDISAIPIIHKLSHLPMTADPSHGTGRRDKVAPMALPPWPLAPMPCSSRFITSRTRRFPMVRSRSIRNSLPS